jgi:hypothetical protein
LEEVRGGDILWQNLVAMPILNKNDIPYSSVAGMLLAAKSQKLIPFLGAGASLHVKSAEKPQVNFPDPAEVSRLITQLNLDGKAKTFLEIATMFAFLIQSLEARPHRGSSKDDLSNADWPPSAGELVEVLSREARFSSLREAANAIRDNKLLPADYPRPAEEDIVEILKLLAQATGIGQPPDLLSSISNYFEARLGRKALWEDLEKIFSNKTKSLAIHDLLADIAFNYLKSGAVVDYLIITTNYDCLIEESLDRKEVPYAVLVTTKRNQQVLVHFSDSVPGRDQFIQHNTGQYPNQFTVMKTIPLVVIYKMHGSLHPKLSFENEGVVISDSDYVDYISRASGSNGALPSHVRILMRGKPFLFMGYSLSDWNVRSMFETVTKERVREEQVRDLSVMYSVRKYEELFFEKHGITILQTDLTDFANEIRANL